MTSATRLTGNRPWAATAAARFVLLPPPWPAASREALDRHRLAAEQALELANPLLELAGLGRGHHRLVAPHRHRASLGHQTPPAKQQVRRHAVAPSDRRGALAGREALLDDAQLLVRGPVSPAGDAGDHLDPAGSVVGHEHVPKHKLEPSMVTPDCPVEMGGSSWILFQSATGKHSQWVASRSPCPARTSTSARRSAGGSSACAGRSDGGRDNGRPRSIAAPRLAAGSHGTDGTTPS